METAFSIMLLFIKLNEEMQLSHHSDFAGLNLCLATLAGRHPFQSDIFHFFRTKEKYFFLGGGGGRGWKHFVTIELIGNLVLNYHYHHELQA